MDPALLLYATEVRKRRDMLGTWLNAPVPHGLLLFSTCDCGRCSVLSCGHHLGRLGFRPESGLSRCLTEKFSIYLGCLKELEFCRWQTPHTRCFVCPPAFARDCAATGRGFFFRYSHAALSKGRRGSLKAEAHCVALNRNWLFCSECMIALIGLRSPARLAWFLETVLLPRQLLIVSRLRASSAATF